MANFKKSKAEILNQIGIEILAEYEDKNLRASGNFEQLVNVQYEGGQPYLTVPYYTAYITDGIGSIGGFNPWAIEQWIKDKGILARNTKTGRFAKHSQIAFAIAKKIRDQGTDIFLGKRQGLYLTSAVGRALENKLPSLAFQITDQILDRGGLKKNIKITL
jgi:hypothetical protein